MPTPLLVNLDPDLISFAFALGNGNKTLGIRRALSYCQATFAPGITNAPAELLRPTQPTRSTRSTPSAHVTDFGNLADAVKLARCVFNLGLTPNAHLQSDGWVPQRVVAKRLQWPKYRYEAAQTDAVAANMLDIKNISADGLTPAMVRSHVGLPWSAAMSDRVGKT